MPAPVSVIIPTLNAESGLVDCFVSLSEGLEIGLIAEVIVVDGGSIDKTVEIADRWGAELVSVARPSRGRQLAKGADVAKGQHFLFLHADTRLSQGWAGLVAAQLGHGPACFKLLFRSNHPMAVICAAWANFRTKFFGLPYGDQGLLISRRLYHDVGGYPDQPLMEDVAMSRKLNGIKMLPVTASTNAEKYIRDGWFRRGARNLVLLTRYLFGAKPENLIKKY